MADDLHETVAERLRSVEQRYTAGRRRLVERLSGAGQPLAIADVLGDGRDRLPQSSAYRNLAVLEDAGVVHRIVTDSGFALYELAEDLTEHHHHLLCSSCGSVADFTAPAALERTVRRVIDEVGRERGFSAEGHRLDLVGTCADCSNS